MEIERRLSRFPVPERVQREWEYDMRISARGVAADRELVDGALYCGTAIEEAAKQEAIELTGLENPKSREQMLTWLQGHGVAHSRPAERNGRGRTRAQGRVRAGRCPRAGAATAAFQGEYQEVQHGRYYHVRGRSHPRSAAVLRCKPYPDDGQGGLCRCRTCRVLICTAPCWTPPAI